MRTRKSIHRCGGDPEAPGGSRCLVEPAGAIFCYGYLDRTGQGDAVALRVALDEEPAPIVLPVCEAHRRPMLRWAAANWSHIAPGAWVDGVDGINAVLEHLRSDGGFEKVAVNPDPAWAVRVEAV